MTPASQWRLALAHALAEQYATLPDVSAVFVGGSTARQQADRFSDIELTVLWTAPPTEQVRSAVVARLAGDLHRLYAYVPQEGLWEDAFYLGRNQDNLPKSGCQVEVSHYLQATMAAAVDQVLLAFAPDQELHNMMAGIRDSVPLLNAPMIDTWKDRLRRYPDGLQLAVLQRYGIIDHFWRWEMLLARGNNRMELATMLTAALHQNMHLLLGLNRIYYGGFKWLATLIPQLTIAPPDLAERIHRVFELPPGEAAAEVQSIVGQTFTLIEHHVPSVNVARFREVFAYQRPQWDEPPPLAMPPQ